MFALRGDAIECPCCGRHFARLMDDWNRPNAICPRCGSHERHRMFWLWVRDRAEVRGDVLHFAPEYCLEGNLRNLPGLRYRTSDLADTGADLQLDITAMSLPDESLDVIICSHVLEHVEDERAALAELRRVLRPGGWAAVLVPVDHDREQTYEDPAIVTPQQRVSAYWQHDHVRLYGRDITARLAAGGFDVEVEAYARDLGAAARERHRLLVGDEIYRCVRPEA